MILIVTNKDDTHSDFVIEELKKRKAPFFRLNVEDIPSVISFNLHYAKNIPIIQLEYNSKSIDLSTVSSVYYRRPMDPIVSLDIENDVDKSFITKETKVALKGLWYLLEDRFWVNHPQHNIKAGNKLLQLKLAREIGFVVPETLITNNPKSAKNFYKRKGENIIAKLMSGGFLDRDGKTSMIYTNKISKKHIEKIDFIKYSPTLLQEYIPKKVELRITIVGDEIFTCEIHSQNSERTKDDWRRYDLQNTPHKIHKLPNDISEKCLTLLKKMNLNFGAIDMIVTQNNEYVFLEINPNGQWYWIEKLTGLNISNALVSFLIKGGSNEK